MDFIVLDDSKEMRRLEIRKHIIKKILDEPNVKLKRRHLTKLKIDVLFIISNEKIKYETIRGIKHLIPNMNNLKNVLKTSSLLIFTIVKS